MVHCCEEGFFEMFWGQQMQEIIRCLLHDLSNCLTGNLALSELYCEKASDGAPEKFAIIRDNCYKEREILKQLSQIHHAAPGNVAYIDLQAFMGDLQPIFARLLPAHAKFNGDHSKSSEALIKFDPALLQRIFLLTMLLIAEAFENASNPKLDMHVVCKESSVACQIKNNVLLALNTEDLMEINLNHLSLTRIYGPMTRFYLQKYNGSFSFNILPEGGSNINLKFPLVT